MGAFNTVQISERCPCCTEEVDVEVQFKYGDTYQHRYKLGDVIKWGGNDIRRPGRSRVLAEGFAVCPISDTELLYEVWLELDKVVAVTPDTGAYNLATDEGYTVVEE